MPQKPSLTKEIEDYLAGELSPEHLAEFEKRVREEKGLEDEIKIIRKVIEGIQGCGFKQMLKEIHNELFDEDGNPRDENPVGEDSQK